MKTASEIARSTQLGVSFSLKTCNDYGIDWQECLSELLSIGIRRFRIMSYWDLHEPAMGNMDFRQLDKQIEMIVASGGTITLAIGMRQPRWPETHLPQWAIGLTPERRETFFMSYLETVVSRYKDDASIESYQLENEFWNRGFGLNNNFSRDRLLREFELVRRLDPERPIIMSLANTYGLPLGKPKPDLFGSTLYLNQFERGRYTKSIYKPWYFSLRRRLVRLVGRRELIIHELQAEPWGPKANWEMSDEEQVKSMNAEKLRDILQFANDTGISYMDLWGGEWWYWRKVKRSDTSLLETIQTTIKT